MSRTTTFTIIPRTWERTPEQLALTDPNKLLAPFRTDLYRNGAAENDGWLVAFLHGEFDPVAQVSRLHVHGGCSSEMVPVLDRLRSVSNYRSTPQLPDGSWSPVYRRVWIARQPLHSMPDPITYLMQSFWPSRPIYVDADGKRRRVRQKQAIREPFHSQMLLWFDRWHLKDLTLLIGLRVTQDGLIRTRPKL